MPPPEGLGCERETAEDALRLPVTVANVLADVDAALDGVTGDAVDGTPEALGRALAWRSARWPLRQALAEAFALPGRSAELAAEDGVG